MVIASGIMMVELQLFVKKVGLNLGKSLEGHLFQALVFRLEFAILKILQMKIGLIVLEVAMKGQLVVVMVVMLARQAMEL